MYTVVQTGLPVSLSAVGLISPGVDVHWYRRGLPVSLSAVRLISPGVDVQTGLPVSLSAVRLISPGVDVQTAARRHNKLRIGVLTA